jgi:hypothetical protein
MGVHDKRLTMPKIPNSRGWIWLDECGGMGVREINCIRSTSSSRGIVWPAVASARPEGAGVSMWNMLMTFRKTVS